MFVWWSRVHWWQVLGLEEKPKKFSEAVNAYRAEAKKKHPDSGGSHEDFIRLNTALQMAKKELKRKKWRKINLKKL